MEENFNNFEEQVQTETSNYTNPYASTGSQFTAPAPKSNLIAGLVGAFLGSLIGGILWVIIYKLGFIAGLAGAVAAICAMKGYEMLGKVLDKKGVICSIIIVLITIFLANKIAWSWEIYDVYTKDFGFEMSFFDAFINADEIISLSDLTFDYYKDLLIGYALTAVACFGNIVEAFKGAK